MLDSWEELEPALRAVYHASFRARTRADGRNEICATPDAVLLGVSPIPARPICTPIDEILAAGAGYPSLAVEGGGLAATVIRGQDEILLATVPDEACGGPCVDRFREALWPPIRCGDLTRFWSEVPAADRACARDEDCVLLEAMCFEDSVREDRAAGYRAVLIAHGGACLDPAEGACASVASRATCLSGACATLR